MILRTVGLVVLGRLGLVVVDGHYHWKPLDLLRLKAEMELGGVESC